MPGRNGDVGVSPQPTRWCLCDVLCHIIGRCHLVRQGAGRYRWVSASSVLAVMRLAGFGQLETRRGIISKRVEHLPNFALDYADLSRARVEEEGDA